VSAQRAVVTVAAAMVCTTVPVFLTGALTGRIGADLAITEAGVGSAVAVFFLAGAAASLPGGRLTDRIGAGAALRIGLAVAAVAALGVAVMADRWWLLAALLGLGGAAMGLVDPGGARALTAAVPERAQGFAFGAKEASVPTASLLAGLTLPVLGERVGWRVVFAGAAALAALVAVTLVRGRLDRPRPSPDAATPPRPASAGRPAPDAPTAADAPTALPTAATSRGTTIDAPVGRVLLLLAVAGGGGGAAAAAVATFLVPSLTGVGVTPSAAGTLLAVASAAGVGMRLLVGLVADRRLGGEIRLVAGLMAGGAVGAVGLASQSLPLVLPGAVLALGAGWGWTGLLFLAAVRQDPSRPARAAGAMLAGLGLGGAAGPALIGTLVEVGGYRLAWSVAAASLAVAAGTAAAAAHTSGRRRAAPIT
jgi:predicted MFS family arabinose efflux permease